MNRFAVIALAVPGCALVDAFTSSSAAIDGGPSDATDASTDPRFACAGQTPPTTAPATITLMGTVDQAGTGKDGFQIALRRRSNDALLDSTTTPSSGTFTLTVTTGGVAIDAYLTSDRSQFSRTRGFLPEPMHRNYTGIPLTMLTPADMMVSAGWVGTTYNSARAMIGIGVVDCLGAPIAGAVVTVSPAPQVLAYDDPGIDQPNELLSMTQATGIAVAYNVQAGNVIVGARLGNLTFRSVTILGIAGELDVVQIHP